MITRSKLKLGDGELVETNPEIGRVYSKREMTEENPLASDSVHGQFHDHESHRRRNVLRIQ